MDTALDPYTFLNPRYRQYGERYKQLNANFRPGLDATRVPRTAWDQAPGASFPSPPEIRKAEARFAMHEIPSVWKRSIPPKKKKKFFVDRQKEFHVALRSQ